MALLISRHLELLQNLTSKSALTNHTLIQIHVLCLLLGCQRHADGGFDAISRPKS